MIVFDRVYTPDRVRQVIFAQRQQRLYAVRATSKQEIQQLLEARLGPRLKMPTRVRMDSGGRTTAVAHWWRRMFGYLRLNSHLRKQEADSVIWRKHWAVLIGPLLAPLATLVVILVAFYPTYLYLGEVSLTLRNTAAVLLAFSGLGALSWVAYLIADWRNDTYEVSRSEIVDVEKKPLWGTEIKRAARLLEIDNIEVDIPSPLHFILDFGNVTLQTAGKDGKFTFDWVPQPREVAAEIRRRIEDFRRVREQEAARQRAQELPDWFELYDRLKPEEN